MKKLYITDLDGTLLNRQSQISPKSLKIINDLIEKGMPFTYATARSFNSASIATKGLTLKLPVILYNGALILDPSTKEVLSSLKFTSDEKTEITGLLRQKEAAILAYAYINEEEKVSWTLSRENIAIQNYIQSRKGDARLRPVTNENELFEGDPFYFVCIGEKAELTELYQKFIRLNRYHCTLQQELYRDEYWLEIMPANATKAEAIKTLMDMYDYEKIVTFGDAINDKQMFELSDEAYAMANAVDELKEVATRIIGSNIEDSVATWLQENVEI